MATLRRTTRDGKKGETSYWIVDFRSGGRRRTRHFRIDPQNPGAARQEAELYLADTERRLVRARAGYSDDNGPQDVSIPDWCNSFLAAVQPSCSAVYYKIMVSTLQRARNIWREAGIETTGQLRREHLALFVTHERDRGLAPKTVSNYFQVLTRAVRWAVIEGWLHRRMSEGAPVVKVPREEPHIYTSDECEKIVGAATGSLHDMILVALHTGMRRGELVALRGTDVDLSENIIRVRGAVSKTDRPRRVPVAEAIRDVLLPQAGKDGPALCYCPGRAWKPGTVSHQFHQLVEGLGIEGVFHDLRHTWATDRAREGWTLWQIMSAGGWSQPSTVMVYVSLAGMAVPTTSPARVG